MPKAVSKNQQMAAGAALSAKRGEISAETLNDASKAMYTTMTEGDLEEMASQERGELPQKKEED